MAEEVEKKRPRAHASSAYLRVTASVRGGGLRVAVGHAIDGAGVVVRDEDRAVLHLLNIHRPADILVVDQEAGDERLDRLHPAVLVELHERDAAAELVAPVPPSVAPD